jgi:hypothetical protein
MNHNKMANGLVQVWVPVTDSQGRTRVEAHWIDAATAPTHVTHAA